MNILILNTTYQCGGAEKIAVQVLEGMKRRGHQVHEIVSYHRKPEPLPTDVQALYHGTPLLLLNRMLTGNHSNASLTIPYSKKQILDFIRKHQIDIVHLHNAHGNFLGIRDIRDISEVCPIVWTLHDFWALTGHCASPAGCGEQWKTGCKSCPNLQNYPPIRRDISARLWDARAEAFHSSRIHYTVPSRWMEAQFQKSHLKEQSCTCIHNSLNTELWAPYDQSELRKKYGLPTDKRILAFVAADPMQPLKGMKQLTEALSLLSDPGQYLLLVAGRESDLSPLTGLGFSVKQFGYLTEQQKMNEFYALADILINPSLYETFGLTGLEAMASGTPVVAFDICAMTEIITPDTGWCVSAQSSRNLTDAIEAAYSDPDRLKEMRTAARTRAAGYFSEEKMLDAYEQVYQKAAAR